MLAASYWSLLAPAIEMAEESGTFGAFAFLPVAVGFVLGAAFVYGADLLIPVLVSVCGSLPALCPLEVTHPIKCSRFPAGVGFGELGGHSQEPRTLWGEAQGSGAGPGAALLALGHRYPCWWPRAAKNLTLALWKAASSPLPSASAMTGARYRLVSIRDLMKLFFPPRPRGSACAEGSFRLCAVFFFPLFFFPHFCFCSFHWQRFANSSGVTFCFSPEV